MYVFDFVIYMQGLLMTFKHRLLPSLLRRELLLPFILLIKHFWVLLFHFLMFLYAYADDLPVTWCDPGGKKPRRASGLQLIVPQSVFFKKPSLSELNIYIVLAETCYC